MTKTLYLVRHARAEERGARWPDDRGRPLTADGIRRMKRAVDALAGQGVVVDLVLTSPLVRARQTADILAARLPVRPKVVDVPWLEPGVPLAAIVAALAAFRKARRLALVGHEPGIGEVAGWLLGAATPLPFRKGAVACFTSDEWPPEPPVTLEWFVTARLLRRRSPPSRRRSSAR